MELVHAGFPVLQFDVWSDVVGLSADLLVFGQHLLDLTVPYVEQRLHLLQQLRVLTCITYSRPFIYDIGDVQPVYVLQISLSFRLRLEFCE